MEIEEVSEGETEEASEEVIEEVSEGEIEVAVEEAVVEEEDLALLRPSFSLTSMRVSSL